MLIAFFMQPGTVPADAVLYSGQETVQAVLLGLAFITVPWMLLAKPFLLRRRHLAISGYKSARSSRDEPDGAGRRLMDDDSSSEVSDKNGKLYSDDVRRAT